MFADSTGRKGVYENTTEGLWAVHISTPQFWAWRDWMVSALGYKMKGHGEWLTVWSEWPPTTVAGAASIAQRISDMRDELHIGQPVPRRPPAWNGVVPLPPAEYRNTQPS